MEQEYVTAGVGAQNTSPRVVRLGRAGGEVGFTPSGLWAGRGTRLSVLRARRKPPGSAGVMLWMAAGEQGGESASL